MSGCTTKRTFTLAEQLVKKILKNVIVMNVAVEDGKNSDDICFLRAEFLSTMFLNVMKDLFVMVRASYKLKLRY